MYTLVILAWIPFVVALVRFAGPRRATLIAVFGGFLFLPRTPAPGLFLGSLNLDKGTVPGLGLLAGLLVFERKSLRRFRPSWVDIPMALFVVAPLLSFAVNRFTNGATELDLDRTIRRFWDHMMTWSVAYGAGRIYFGDGNGDGSHQIGVAIVVATLLYVPICWFEMLMGPAWYLLGLIYGISRHAHMVQRLGGYRPEGFLTNGIELCTWMAMATVVAYWLWRNRGWSLRGLPFWAPALILFLTTVACRGIYGYAVLIIGLAAAFLTWTLRTRVVLALLALCIPVYPAVRITGAWNGEGLRQVAQRMDKESSLDYRLYAETAYIKQVADHNLAFGVGGGESGIYLWFAQTHLWPDGWWIHTLRWGGVVGLTAHFLAFFLWPAGLVIARLPARSIRELPGSTAWSLALLLTLHGIDSLQNMAYLTPSTLLAGSLAGYCIAYRSATRRAARGGSWTNWRQQRPWTSASEPERRSLVATRLILLVLGLIALEVIGHLSQTPWSPDTSLQFPAGGPAAPGRESSSADPVPDVSPGVGLR